MSCVSLTKKRRGKYQRETTWFVAVDPKSDEFIANKCLAPVQVKTFKWVSLELGIFPQGNLDSSVFLLQFCTAPLLSAFSYRILLVVIFITAITQSSSPRHKKEIQAVFVCLHLLLPRDKELLLCEGDKKRRNTCRWPPCREGSGSLSSQIFVLLLCDLSVFEI